MEQARLRVLVVDENCSRVSPLVRFLKDLGCSCFFARSYTDASALLGKRRFDVVLTKFGLRGGDIRDLPNRLIGGKASLFYFYAVEVGCWWIPRVLFGRECLGEPALKPIEFVKTIREIVTGTVGDVGVDGHIATNAPPARTGSRLFQPRPKLLSA